MRLKNIENAKELVFEFPYVIKDTFLCKNKWQEIFNNTNPIHIELGMGKGQFITKLANLNPNINYVGIEKNATIVLKACRKISNDTTKFISNLKFIVGDVSMIDEMFNEKDVNLIYLNFSDPWPKKRHIKKRMTSGTFLVKYKKILKNSSYIVQKTDQIDFFEYSIDQFTKEGFKIIEIDYNSKNSITTEYEDKFRSLNNSIMYLKVLYENNE